MPPTQNQFAVVPHAANSSSQGSLSNHSWTITHLNPVGFDNWHATQAVEALGQRIDALAAQGVQEETGTNSSWHEEAHWMSFQNAVQYVMNRRLLKTASPQPWPNNADEDSLERLVSSVHANQAVSPVRSVLSLDELSAAAIELAETRAKLAIVEAERDQMEVAMYWNLQSKEPDSHGKPRRLFLGGS